MINNKTGDLFLLPCAPGVCQDCAVDHDPTEPHNATSLYYQYKFYGAYGRWPTWVDAMAHCDAKTRTAWTAELKTRGKL